MSKTFHVMDVQVQLFQKYYDAIKTLKVAELAD
jgi:hypothetical protein